MLWTGIASGYSVIGGTGQTLQSIANQINGQLTGATASVDSGGHLVITSNSTGSSSSIAITAGTHDATSTLGLGGSPVAGTAAVNG